MGYDQMTDESRIKKNHTVDIKSKFPGDVFAY